VRRKLDLIVKGHRSVKFKGVEIIRWLKMISLVVLIILKHESTVISFSEEQNEVRE
jgi:hypothetical protein